jgi:tripartite-type tricarboxylate transporter receptor subunit TctC
MEQPPVKAALAREGTEVDLSKSSDDFGAFLEKDGKVWVKLVKDAGVKLD